MLAEPCTRELTNTLTVQSSKPRRKRRSRWKIRLDIRFREITLTITVNLRRRAGRWYVRFTLDGRQWERSTGETDRDKALCKISEIVKQAVREIENGYTGKTKVVTTLSELAKEYIPYAEAHKAKSTVEKEASKMKLLVSAFGERKLTGITVRDIELYMQYRSKVVKPRTVNLELALLRHMLNKAVDWGYLKGNPAKRVKPFKEPPGRIRYLRRDEYDRLLSVCQLTPGLYEIVLTALETGMRKGELMSLTWDDVDLERGEITLKQTKNNKLRTIPISDTLCPLLEELSSKRLSSLVFTRPDGTLYGDPYARFQIACKRACIEDFRFHDLRHTFASYLVMGGVDIRTVQELIGHRTITMTMRYSHLSRTHLRDAVNRIRAGLGQTEEGLEGQSHKLSIDNAPVAQKDRASDF